MNLKIEQYITKLDVTKISETRKITLQPFIYFIQEKRNQNQTIRINFICTHNSRRSHLAQIWAQTMAHYFKVGPVFCYSGGTEATALFPKITETLQNVGFEIAQISEGKNPIYSIKFSENEHPIIGFSKKINHDFNPKSNFAAIMTCSQTDEGCPFVLGAEKRIPITYEDPKAYDNTGLQTEKYHERSEQIAAEMYHVFSQIKK